MEYLILEADDRNGLETAVRRALDAGWTTCGGVAEISQNGHFMQAVTRATATAPSGAMKLKEPRLASKP